MKKNIVYGLFLIIIIINLAGCSTEKSAKSYHKSGMKSFEKGEYEEAKNSLAMAVKTNPDKAEYYIEYGFTLIKTNQIEEALVQFDKGIIDKDNKVVRENNKNAHRGKGIAYYEEGEYEKAILEFDEALKIKDISKLNKDLLYYKASSYEKAGLYEEALASYKILLDKKPNAATYGMIGRTQYTLGAFDEALDSYNKAIKLDKDAYEYYFQKYAILVEKGDTTSANDVLTKASSIKNKTKEDNYNVAKLKYLSGDYEEAEIELKESVQKGFIEANYYLGEISMANKDYQSAIVYYNEYLDKESNIKLVTVYNQLAVCLMSNNEYEDALSVLDIGLKHKEASILKDMLYNEVIIYEHLGRFDEAYSKAKEFLNIYPDDEEMVREKEFLNTRQLGAKAS